MQLIGKVSKMWERNVSLEISQNLEEMISQESKGHVKFLEMNIIL